MLLVSFHDFRWTIDGNPAHDRYTSVPLRRKPAASAEICFPAIAIAGGDSFTVVDSLPECGTTKALRAGYFRRLALFDSSGLLWPVVHAVSTPSILDHLFNRVVRVALWVGDPESDCLPEVVERLCRLVDSDPDDLYDQGESHAQLKAEFRQAKDAKELIAAICGS